MFRIDDNDVVDATLCGNAARFINHSCEVSAFPGSERATEIPLWSVGPFLVQDQNVSAGQKAAVK